MKDADKVNLLELQITALRERLESTNHILDQYIKVVDRLSKEKKAMTNEVVSLQIENSKLINEKKDLQIQIALLYEILITNDHVPGTS